MIEPFDSEATYRAAIDATLAAAGCELRIFDNDLVRMALDDVSRNGSLKNFLAAGQNNHLRLVVHDPEPLRNRHPRLLDLIRHRGHQIEVRQTPEHLRHLADCFILADQKHAAIRFHADHPRGKHMTDEPKETHPYWQRFDELWLESRVCTLATTGI